MPDQVVLGTGYPNPFSDIIKIPYALPENPDGFRVVIDILNLRGQTIVNLVSEEKYGGYYNVDWTANRQGLAVSKGLYLVKMEVRSTSEHLIITRKILKE